MNYIDLKQGDVIVFVDGLVGETIALYSCRLEDTINNYVELYPDGTIGIGSFDAYRTEVPFRMATEEEKIKLYDALCVYFGEEYDKEWTKHFTDSSYCDILDYLLEVFCIESHEYDDNYHLIIPEFVDEIQNYIWDKMCEFMGQPNKTGVVEVEEESEVKMVSLDKACKVFQEMLMKYNKYIGHNIPMVEWEDEFRKRLDETTADFNR